MSALRLVLPSVLLATVFPIEFASAAGALLAHRAVYDLDLGEASEKSGVTAVAGRIVYEFTGSRCEGYSTNYRFVSQMSVEETQRMNDYQMTTFEDGEGKSFDFVTKFFVDDGLDKETKGSAAIDAEGLAVKLQKPQATTVELPATRFPTQHMIELIDKAKAGENFYETSIFDGSDDANKVMTTTVVIGRKTTPAANDPELPALKTLKSEPYWPVSIAYFDLSKDDGEEVPDYAISFKLYDNGFTRDLTMSYGEFSIKAKLVGLDLLDSKDRCGQPE
ncbi:MAG: cell envelope integrity EipB family protein [Mesorhizobium sp.]|nr:cell envelope integrity EipB family protein [Mesorhizobium sp.]MCO5163431.1 cell envelope integrity EipB family protein [Mesorhizobium sp.]